MTSQLRTLRIKFNLLKGQDRVKIERIADVCVKKKSQNMQKIRERRIQMYTRPSVPIRSLLGPFQFEKGADMARYTNRIIVTENDNIFKYSRSRISWTLKPTDVV